MGIDAEMFIKVPRKLKPKEVRAESIKIASAFGSGAFFVQRPSTYETVVNGVKKTHTARGRHALELVTKVEQDGPSVKAEDGESIVRCSLWGRYYGIGYERGNLPLLLSIARYLRKIWPDGEVWYGGDSSGVVAERLDADYEGRLWDHFCSARSRDYFSNPYSIESGTMHRCDFCEIPLINNMWGGGGAIGVYCISCGHHWLVIDGKLEERGNDYDSQKLNSLEERERALQDALAAVAARDAKVESGDQKVPQRLTTASVRPGRETAWTFEVVGRLDNPHEAYERAATELMKRAEEVRR